MKGRNMKIKYIPTGHIFDLPEEECKRIWKESPFNYEVLDGKFDAGAQTPNTSVANKVLGEADDAKEKTLEEMTVKELKALCDEKEIEYAKSATKPVLIALLEKDAETEEETEEEEETEDGENDGEADDANTEDGETEEKGNE